MTPIYPPQNSPDMVRSRAKKCLFSAITLLLILALWVGMEFVLAAILPDQANPLHRTDPFARFLKEGRLAVYRHQFYHELLPQTRAVSLKGTVYETSSLGLNNQEIPHHPLPGVVRVVALGDSSLFGWEVARGEAFPARLAAWFRDRLPERTVEVINAGVPGYTSRHGLIFLRKRIFRLQPHIILVSFGWNECRQPLARLRLAHTLVNRRFRFFDCTMWLQEHSRLFRGLSTVAVRAVINRRMEQEFAIPNQGSEIYVPGEQIRKGVHYREYLENSIELCRERGIMVVCVPVSVPDFYRQVMQRLAAERNLLYVDVEHSMFQAERRIQNAIRRSRGLDAQILEPLPEDRFSWLREQRHLFLDDCHPNQRGYRVIAGEVGRALLPVIDQL